MIQQRDTSPNRTSRSFRRIHIDEMRINLRIGFDFVDLPALPP
jgi:hypothetical protein